MSFAPPALHPCLLLQSTLAFPRTQANRLAPKERAKDLHTLSTLPFFFFRLGPRKLTRRGRDRETCHRSSFIDREIKYDRSISRLVGTLLFFRTRSIIEESISHPFFVSSAPRAGPAMDGALASVFRANLGKMYCINGRPVRGSHGPRKGKGKGKGGDSLTTPPPPTPPTPPDAFLLFSSLPFHCSKAGRYIITVQSIRKCAL